MSDIELFGDIIRNASFPDDINNMHLCLALNIFKNLFQFRFGKHADAAPVAVLVDELWPFLRSFQYTFYRSGIKGRELLQALA